MSGSKISRMETGGLGVYPADLEKLLDFYQVTKNQRVELLDLARNAEERGLLRMNNSRLPEDWQTWADFEDEATGLLHYQPLVVPGLLQTPEYARNLIRATGHGLSDIQVDSMVASRMARQGLLSRTKPLTLNAMIEQSAMERPFGDPGAHKRQIRHLLNAAGLPNITLRIVPTEGGQHPGLNGPFVLLEYDQEASLVLLENKVSSLFLDEDEQIQVYEEAWTEIGGYAYSIDETVDYLRRRA